MTYKELIELINLIKLNLGNQTTKGQKKLFKIYEKVKHHVDEYQSQIDEIRLDNASVDDKNNVIVDEKGNYKFSKEALKKLNADFKALENKEFEFNKINVVNPQGLEIYTFLDKWVEGVEFIKQEDEQL